MKCKPSQSNEGCNHFKSRLECTPHLHYPISSKFLQLVLTRRLALRFSHQTNLPDEKRASNVQSLESELEPVEREIGQSPGLVSRGKISPHAEVNGSTGWRVFREQLVLVFTVRRCRNGRGAGAISGKRLRHREHVHRTLNMLR